jgi:hypothetical protein
VLVRHHLLYDLLDHHPVSIGDCRRLLSSAVKAPTIMSGVAPALTSGTEPSSDSIGAAESSDSSSRPEIGKGPDRTE